MIMEARDKAALVEMVKEYPIQDIMEVLKEAVGDRIDELIDLELNDKAKEMNSVYWNLLLLKCSL